MQYLIQDLIKLPLADRLSIVEKVICTLEHTDYEQELFELMRDKLNAFESSVN